MTSLTAQLVKNLPVQCRRPGFNPWVGKILWRRERLPTPVVWPGEFHGLWVAKSQTQLSDFHIHIYRDTAIYTIYANMHIDIYVYPCIDTYVYVYKHMHTYIYTQICTYASTHIYDRWLIIQYFSLNFTQTAKINAYCNNLNNRKATKLSLLIHTPPFLFPPFQCNQFFLNNLKFKINLL